MPLTASVEATGQKLERRDGLFLFKFYFSISPTDVTPVHCVDHSVADIVFASAISTDP